MQLSLVMRRNASVRYSMLHQGEAADADDALHNGTSLYDDDDDDVRHVYHAKALFIWCCSFESGQTTQAFNRKRSK